MILVYLSLDIPENQTIPGFPKTIGVCIRKSENRWVEWRGSRRWANFELLYANFKYNRFDVRDVLYTP